MTAPVHGMPRFCTEHNLYDCQWCFPLYHKREKTATCGTCVFFEGGRCHRNPPVMFPVEPMMFESGFVQFYPPTVLFPEVDGGDWCGEFKRRAVEKGDTNIVLGIRVK